MSITTFFAVAWVLTNVSWPYSSRTCLDGFFYIYNLSLQSSTCGIDTLHIDWKCDQTIATEEEEGRGGGGPWKVGFYAIFHTFTNATCMLGVMGEHSYPTLFEDLVANVMTQSNPPFPTNCSNTNGNIRYNFDLDYIDKFPQIFTNTSLDLIGDRVEIPTCLTSTHAPTTTTFQITPTETTSSTQKPFSVSTAVIISTAMFYFVICSCCFFMCGFLPSNFKKRSQRKKAKLKPPASQVPIFRPPQPTKSIPNNNPNPTLLIAGNNASQPTTPYNRKTMSTTLSPMIEEDIETSNSKLVHSSAEELKAAEESKAPEIVTEGNPKEELELSQLKTSDPPGPIIIENLKSEEKEENDKTTNNSQSASLLPNEHNPQLSSSGLPLVHLHEEDIQRLGQHQNTDNDSSSEETEEKTEKKLLTNKTISTNEEV